MNYTWLECSELLRTGTIKNGPSMPPRKMPTLGSYIPGDPDRYVRVNRGEGYCGQVDR